MIEFMVIEKKEGDQWEGHGPHKFRVVPQKGRSRIVPATIK